MPIRPSWNGDGFSGNRFPEVIPSELTQELGITLEWLESVEDQVNQEIEKAKVFLKLAE